MKTNKSILWVLLISLLAACNPSIKSLAPEIGNAGDVIDIRDPGKGGFGTGGIIYFGSVEASNVLSWTTEDIYVEVPPGLSGSVPVQVLTGTVMSNAMDFLVVDHVESSRIMCFGDSMFYSGIPEKLQVLVDQDPDLSELNPVVLSQGRGAELVVTAWSRWVNALNCYNDLDLVVLLHGANDVDDGAGLPLEAIQHSMMNMIDEALLRGIDLVVCSLLPRVGSCADSASPTTESFNDWLVSYADGLSIPFVDIYEDFMSTPSWEETLFDADNCTHPNRSGKQRIAELLKDKLREFFLPSG